MDMSFLKKIFGLEDLQITPKSTCERTDITPVGPFLQRKFARGIHYNMKVVIRGDRNVGKSTLLSRLKGEPFKEAYIPSTEIQVASIHWNYKDTSDVIKVEVWDVIDKGKPRCSTKGLKLTHCSEPELCLDAEFLDVYQGAHGVILMLDMTKSWTFDYVCRELPLVPVHLPVLIMANFRDLGHHRTVTEEQVRSFLETEPSNPIGRSPGAPCNVGPKCRPVRVQYCEASMRNGFGLLYVHKFFSLPFLCLQHSVLHQQLERNEMETTHAIAELETDDCLFSTNQTAYELYLKMRRERAAFELARRRETIPEATHASPKRLTDQNITPLQPQASSTQSIGILTHTGYDSAVSHEPRSTFHDPAALTQQATVTTHEHCPVDTEHHATESLETNPVVSTVQDEVDLGDVMDRSERSVQGLFHSATTSRTNADNSNAAFVDQADDEDVIMHRAMDEEGSSWTSADYSKMESANQSQDVKVNICPDSDTSDHSPVALKAPSEDPSVIPHETQSASWDKDLDKEGWVGVPLAKPRSPEVTTAASLARIASDMSDALVTSVEDAAALEKFLSDD